VYRFSDGLLDLLEEDFCGAGHTVAFRDRNLDSSVFGKIPFPIFARCTLTSEASAA
jgi:hypothetical protein